MSTKDNTTGKGTVGGCLRGLIFPVLFIFVLVSAGEDGLEAIKKPIIILLTLPLAIIIILAVTGGLENW